MDELKPKSFSYPHIKADLDLCENQIDALCGARPVDEATLHIPAVETDFDMQFNAALEELKAYRKTGFTPEELSRRYEPENKALMVTLPCNIGAMVYEAEDGLPIITYRVTGFVLGKTEFEDENDIEERQGWQVEYGKSGIDCECPISEFGKSLFLTHKEAEQALADHKPGRNKTV